MSEKTKVFIISDHPMAPSGVGTQTKYIIEALIKTGRYKFICLGGAIKHPSYEPQKVEGFIMFGIIIRCQCSIKSFMILTM